ncbi:hypothetical protein GS601_22095 [Myxacorys almedinensis A]|uniref:Uncharacterized protein n=2 Tax=Myxacorys TaxID=2056239 RepID=A0A8J8CPS7_9CYAN|nr:hypothetical protein [Myxacorys almedinensis A]
MTVMHDALDKCSSDVELVPPKVEPMPTTWRDDVAQGVEFVRFVWRISSRIRGGWNRFRFVVGLIFWKPFLPDDTSERGNADRDS